MAYKCIEANYVKRLYEKGVLYDSIGAALPKYFEEVEASEKDLVVETVDEDKEPDTGEIPVVDAENDKLRDDVTADLKELGIEFDESLSTSELLKILEDGRASALNL